jgi:Protein of unknown function (DUF2501)
MTRLIVLSFAIASVVQPAHAQLSAPPIPSVLPDVSSISRSNAAGVLQYCKSKELVSISGADEVLDVLTRKPEVTKSPDFTAGAAGQIRGDKSFAIASVPGYLQAQACASVLSQARHFL